MAQRKRYIFVCINRRPDGSPKGSCAAKGSEQVYATLKEALAAEGMAALEARACTSSCLDMCAHGVSVLVEPDHRFLGHVTVNDVPAIIEGLRNDKLPEHLLMPLDPPAK